MESSANVTKNIETSKNKKKMQDYMTSMIGMHLLKVTKKSMKNQM